MHYKKIDMGSKQLPTDNGEIRIYEYPPVVDGFSMDGAIADFNGSTGFKTNPDFDEILFVVSGTIKVTEIINNEEKTYEAEPGDCFTLKRGEKHRVEGKNAKAFIACNPPFSSLDR